jgi:hypothetical protein
VIAGATLTAECMSDWRQRQSIYQPPLLIAEEFMKVFDEAYDHDDSRARHSN